MKNIQLNDEGLIYCIKTRDSRFAHLASLETNYMSFCGQTFSGNNNHFWQDIKKCKDKAKFCPLCRKEVEDNGL